MAAEYQRRCKNRPKQVASRSYSVGNFSPLPRRNSKTSAMDTGASALLDSDYTLPSYPRARDRRSMILTSSATASSSTSNLYAGNYRDSRESRERSESSASSASASSAANATASLASVLASLEKFGEKLEEGRSGNMAQAKPPRPKKKLLAEISMESTETKDSIDLGSFPDRYHFVDDKLMNEMLVEMRQLWEFDQLCDVTLVVDNKEFRCHRIVLAACSPYFQAMFTGGLLESQQDRIHIGGVDAPSMKLVLEYAYSAELEVNENNVQGLMLAVNMLQMHRLRDACAKFLQHHVTTGNCVGIYFFAVAHDSSHLRDLSQKVLCENFHQVIKEEEFLTLPADKIADLLAQDDLNVDQEELVYEAALAWLKHDLDNRKPDLFCVMKNVRFALMSPYYIHDVVERDRFVSGNREVQYMIDRALQYHVLRDRRQDLDLTKVNLTPRRGMPYRDMFLFLANHNEGAAVNSKGDSYRIKTLPDMMDYAECVLTGDNNIYVAGKQPPDYGGRRSYSSYRRGGIFLYDHVEKKWLPRAAMNTQRSHFSMTVMDGLIYVTGGSNADGFIDSMECYDPSTNQWRFLAPLPKLLRHHVSAAVLGRLYCIGGETSEQSLDTVFCFNPRRNEWETVAGMILPRSCAGVGVLNREIYVIGGNVAKDDKDPENMLKSVEIYNPEENEWRFGPELPEARMNVVVVANKGTLFCFGGVAGTESGVDSSNVWKLDAKKASWVIEDPDEWPALEYPFYCVIARMSKKDA